MKNQGGKAEMMSLRAHRRTHVCVCVCMYDKTVGVTLCCIICIRKIEGGIIDRLPIRHTTRATLIYAAANPRAIRA